jgi:hypothetical protein
MQAEFGVPILTGGALAHPSRASACGRVHLDRGDEIASLHGASSRWSGEPIAVEDAWKPDHLMAGACRHLALSVRDRIDKVDGYRTDSGLR